REDVVHHYNARPLVDPISQKDPALTMVLGRFAVERAQLVRAIQLVERGRGEEGDGDALEGRPINQVEAVASERLFDPGRVAAAKLRKRTMRDSAEVEEVVRGLAALELKGPGQKDAALD